MRNEYRAYLENRIAFLEKMIEIDKATLKTLDELLEMEPNLNPQVKGGLVIPRERAVSKPIIPLGASVIGFAFSCAL